MNITFKKAIRDIRLYKGRTLLMLTGILIGIAAFGAVLSSYAVLSREMNRNFMDTNPASMLFTIRNPDANAAKLIKAQFPDTDIEMRQNAQARISRGRWNLWNDLSGGRSGFGQSEIDTFELEKGHIPETENQLMLERDDLKILKNLTVGVG